MNLLDLTIIELHEGFKKKQFTSTEVTKAYLEQIKKTDGQIGAYLTVTEELALAQAEAADKIIATKKEFPMLCGIPFSVKDLIMVEGQICTAGSKILEKYVAPYDATVIKKLNAQGAVVLGKVNLDEFAMGSSTENSAYKVTKNPHDITRVAGGTSGGSAASVAAKQAVFSLGTDTGGSIRQPASFCGVVGLRTTYGSVSRYGVVADASSLDQVGPIAKTVEDAKIIFEAISGKDAMDATSVDYKFKDINVELKGLKIGVPKEYFAKGIDPKVEKIIREAIKKAQDAGAKIFQISLPSSKYALAAYYIIQTSEASANLARYDGIKYGLSSPAEKLLDVYIKSRGAGFGAEVKRRIMTGTYSLSSGYYDAYYKKAQEVRQLITQDFENAFKKVDVIFAPVSPFPAFKIGENTDNPLAMYLADIYTVSVNLAYLPGLSLPTGKVGKLPVGLQIIGNHFEENKILSVASQMESMLR
ncbi:MAG: aspartyl/glutamyl-tRNA amidotransferase subunit A [Candidatus Staskawiczbacteria bacterium RIFCSPHIGHO2_02_FULL_43_16]|uniref:Glutamyl-tRNA(Gln) amidotransferase subunit A n=1 Tax=Candidatus Staskawiczbacteria bacterium RIFCSPHIGHO2_01_FULL_41_41 TaxID=1802203 RepID=A0A1G2HTT0_9BACT|nr:MAG: aspartyl/glutamyl-tRNA amidotransferase subunit A [Candidatus Staskawiczbacteria bacterium RIFCSPHIGHO2_01_FULL_41_41]OGZ68298.1 MAG: aspartyl/glutamyl-tRNA amidotransferase subunit A [Candidatus Staskawiczbacteria bacterium RIFCSPHIGHO2_02_FULL_43_16]OGZ74687.1 MAG: aspartyl/glutamyl-tRNA amidotransferase subunit A [Candidatus Staskawiczbacteria bacterium RIFCSPLOWO2_01_FULL_43_17b]